MDLLLLERRFNHFATRSPWSMELSVTTHESPLPPAGTPLPPSTSQIVQKRLSASGVLGAYNVCLGYQEQHAEDETKSRHVRVLGYMLLEAPQATLQSEVTREIHSCTTAVEFVALGAFYEEHFLFACKYTFWCDSLRLSSIFSQKRGIKVAAFFRPVIETLL